MTILLQRILGMNWLWIFKPFWSPAILTTYFNNSAINNVFANKVGDLKMVSNSIIWNLILWGMVKKEGDGGMQSCYSIILLEL